MSDRCYTKTTFRKSDANKMAKALGESRDAKWWDSDESDDPKLIVATCSEANYGLCSELDKAAELGVPFLHEWGTGGGYGPGVSVCDGKRKMDQDVTFSGELYVGVSGEGLPVQKQVEATRKFIRLKRRTEKILGIEEPGESP